MINVSELAVYRYWHPCPLCVDSLVHERSLRVRLDRDTDSQGDSWGVQAEQLGSRALPYPPSSIHGPVLRVHQDPENEGECPGSGHGLLLRVVDHSILSNVHIERLLLTNTAGLNNRVRGTDSICRRSCERCGILSRRDGEGGRGSI